MHVTTEETTTQQQLSDIQELLYFVQEHPHRMPSGLTTASVYYLFEQIHAIANGTTEVYEAIERLRTVGALGERTC